MLIDTKLLDKVSNQAATSPRLRMNFNLHESLDAPSQRLLMPLNREPFFPYTPLEPGDILQSRDPQL